MKKVQQTKALHRKKSRNTTRKYFNWYCLKYSPAVTAIWLANCVDLNCFVPCGRYGCAGEIDVTVSTKSIMCGIGLWLGLGLG